MKNLIVGLFVIALIQFISCKADSEDFIIEDHENEPYTLIEDNFYIMVLDENSEAITGAKVIINNQEVNTNKYGLAFFPKTSLKSIGDAAIISHPEYFHTSKIIKPKEKLSKVYLSHKERYVSFNTTVAYPDLIADQIHYNIPENAFIDESGNEYNGLVKMWTRYYDVTNPMTTIFMPGNLKGVDKSGLPVLLSSYGMFSTELTDLNGREIKLKPGAEIGILMPLNNSLANSAPQSLPIWHYDESKGKWIEEGVATKVGTKYAFKVSHFSTWNVDNPYMDFLQFKMRIVDPQGNGISEVFVNLKDKTGGLSGYGVSNSSGYVTGYMPKNVEIAIYFNYNNFCKPDKKYIKDIGPFNDNQDLGEIPVDIPIVTKVLHGKVFDCNDQPNPNAISIMTIDDQSYVSSVNSNGEFQHILPCTRKGTIEVMTQDLNTLIFSPEKELSYFFTETTKDLGIFIGCNQYDTYLEFFRQDSNKTFIYTHIECHDYNENDSFSIWATTRDADLIRHDFTLSFNLNHKTVPFNQPIPCYQYSQQLWVPMNMDTNSHNVIYQDLCLGNCPISIKFYSFGFGYYEGVFSGTAPTTQIHGRFRFPE